MHILPLADEYQMMKLKSDCETWLLHQLHTTNTTSPSSPTTTTSSSSSPSSVPAQHGLKFVSLAQQYQLERLLEAAVELLAGDDAKLRAVEELERHPDYDAIETGTLVRILRRRVTVLEKQHGKLVKTNDTWRKKCEDLEDCLKKMSREKLTIKRALDEVEGAWELKGSDARCIDPVHIYGPRNFTCETCTKQMQTYMQGKIHFLLNRGSNWSGITWPQ